MSKFLFSIHPPHGQLNNIAKPVSSIEPYTKDDWNVFSKNNKQLSVWKKPANLEVDENLNIRLSIPNSDDREADYLTITENGPELEIKGDILGTRVVWYYFDSDRLLVSSSQQLILSQIGNFESNPDAWTWMLSNGSLGPGLSWDKRIRALYAGERLILETITWKISKEKEKWNFEYNNGLKKNMVWTLLISVK